MIIKQNKNAQIEVIEFQLNNISCSICYYPMYETETGRMVCTNCNNVIPKSNVMYILKKVQDEYRSSC